MRHKTYEIDHETFKADAYTTAKSAHNGIAWHILGWETEPAAVFLCDCGFQAIEFEHGGGYVVENGDSECDHENCCQCEEPEFVRTGNVIAIMVGDDKEYTFDLGALLPIKREDYCGECGQIGCTHDGLDRD